MEPRYKVLLFDDDVKLQSLLTEYLQGAGFEVQCRQNGLDAVAALRSVQPSIVILDIMMPGKDGLAVLRTIRAESQVPVIMLTARGDDADRIVGLELGADDYLAKPFNPRELLARMRAVLRRVDLAVPCVSTSTVECAGLVLNTGRQELVIGETVAALSPTETKLMAELMRQPNTEYSRDDLMTRVWGREFNAYDRCIDVHISKLRSVLKSHPEHSERIRTVWGKGYMFLA
ncbi:response regulator transcription factor [Desulfovibrio mangrovi]|uniref:response regulator n=1 Tax=Desulfovibrio mangrovi TaxID=2976983 RepID=UPI0022459D09|nr:response regulator transcription factor [Desulfovibrio mangrovi]UZP67997.1 response regulator transcription factor [Desulfovibrio mangrovi]